jgi:hypothetical protein
MRILIAKDDGLPNTAAQFTRRTRRLIAQARPPGATQDVSTLENPVILEQLKQGT